MDCLRGVSVGDIVYGSGIPWRASLLGPNVGRVSLNEKSQEQPFNSVVAGWITVTIIR